MWTCTVCNQTFKHTKQVHSCNDKELQDFLKGKTEHTISLFWHLINAFNDIAAIGIHPTKTMIAIASTKRIAWITRLGKDFVDISFPFKQAHKDNLCFHKIAQVPGTNQFNHHFRMCSREDINEEVRKFMKMALQQD